MARRVAACGVCVMGMRVRAARRRWCHCFIAVPVPVPSPGPVAGEVMLGGGVLLVVMNN